MNLREWDCSDSERCGVCHNLVSGEPKEGPNLAGTDLQKPREWRIVHFNQSNRPAGRVKAVRLTFHSRN